MLRVKVDEDLPAQVAARLRESGYDAVTVTEQGMGGWKDPSVWQAVQAEDRFFVTADKGFGDIRSHSPGSHSGVLLLRPDEDGIRPILELIQRVLSQYSLDDLAGTVSVVTPRGVRIRRAREDRDS